jgi:hypothetical protein
MGWDDPDLTVGKLMRLFRWFDQQTVDGNARGVTPALLDRLIGVSGFAQAVAHVGWLVVTDAGLTLHNFDRHNGETAKSRALTAKRVSKHRSNAEGNAPANALSVTSPLAREEKSREEKKEKKEAPAALTLSDLEAEGVSREAAAEWIAVRKRKKGGPVTPLAWAGFKSQALKAGWPLEAAVRKCVERSWVSFEAAWVAEGKAGANGAPAGHTVPSRAVDETARYLAGRAEQEKQSTLPPPALLAKVRGAIKEAV